MRNRMYGGVRGRKTKVGEKLLRFPPTRSRHVPLCSRVLLFDKHTEAECMDIFDWWIYIMKNMNMFEQMPFSEKYPVFRKLAEIGDLRKLSREELELYDEDIKNMRDIYATRKFDEKRGMEKGMAKGRAEGKVEGKAEVARNLLAMGMSWSQIMQATGLTEDQLKQLQS